MYTHITCMCVYIYIYIYYTFVQNPFLFGRDPRDKRGPEPQRLPLFRN